MKNKYFYPIYKLKIKSWIKYWLIKQTEFKGVLSDILEGISFYLTDSLNMKFKMFDIIGRTTQEGDPTPENPVPIKNTGDNGSISDKVQNKNLATIRTDLQPYGGTATNSVLRVDTTGKRRGTLIKIKPSTNYVLSKEKGTTNFRYFYFDKEPVVNETVSIGGAYLGSEKTVNITTPANAEYLFVQWTSDNDTSPCGNVQIEQGTISTSYVPHSEQNISFPLSSGQKLMQGDYPADDEKVHHVSGEMLFDGSSDENWIYNPTYAYFYITTSGFKSADFCDNYSKETSETLTNNHFRFNPNNGNLYIKDERFTSASSFKTNLATNNIILQGELAEEQTEDFTEEQKTAWEQIKKARTYKNITHITSEDETPALLKIQYWKEG